MYYAMIMFVRMGVTPTLTVNPGVAPGIFQRGADFSNEGAKCGFQGTITAKNLRKNSFSPSDGG